VTPADVAGWAARSRAAQGLGPKITDAAILGRLAVLAFEGRDPPNREGPTGGPLRDRTLSQEPSRQELNPHAAKRTSGGGGRARR
jgi:hypothetical protein